MVEKQDSKFVDGELIFLAYSDDEDNQSPMDNEYWDEFTRHRLTS